MDGYVVCAYRGVVWVCCVCLRGCWVGVLCVPTGVLGGYVVRTYINVLCVADVVCNSS